MNKKQKIHPVTLWMFAFVIIGLWAAYGQLSGAVFSDSSWFEPGLVTIMLVFIAGVSLWTLPVFFNGIEPSPNDKGRDTLGKVAGFYIEAWNQLRGQKWLLWLFGSVAIFQFINLLGDIILSNFMLADLIKKHSSAQDLMRFSDSGDFFILRMKLPFYIITSIKEALSNFKATIDLHSSYLFTPALVSYLSFIVYLKISKLSCNDETRVRLLFLKRVLLPFSVYCLVYAVIFVVLRVDTLGRIAQNVSQPDNPLLSPIFISIILLIPSSIFSILLNSLFFAGYGGTLIKMRNGVGVSLETFIIDISTYFRSALRVFMILIVIELMAALPSTIGQIRNSSPQNPPFLAFDISTIMNLVSILSLLLLPYIILIKNSQTKISILSSLVKWKDHPGILMTFIAVGVTLSFPLLLSNRCIVHIIPGRLNQESIYGIITGLWSSGTLTFIAIIMSLAIFNLYTHLTKDDVKDVEPMSTLS